MTCAHLRASSCGSLNTRASCNTAPFSIPQNGEYSESSSRSSSFLPTSCICAIAEAESVHLLRRRETDEEQPRETHARTGEESSRLDGKVSLVAQILDLRSALHHLLLCRTINLSPLSNVDNLLGGTRALGIGVTLGYN